MSGRHHSKRSIFCPCPFLPTALFFLALCSIFPAPSARAGPGRIGINFWTEDYGGSASNTWLATNVSAGVVAQTNWNNVKTPFFMGDNLAASNFHSSVGAASPMTMFVDSGYAGYGEARTNGLPSNATGQLLNGRLTAHYGLNITLSVEEVPLELYDVYVYVSGPSGANETITLTSEGYSGPPSYCLRSGDPTSFTSFSQVTSTNPASPSRGNYVRFRNVEDAAFSIYFDAAGDPGGKKRIYGIQLIELTPTKEDAAMILAR